MFWRRKRKDDPIGLWWITLLLSRHVAFQKKKNVARSVVYRRVIASNSPKVSYNRHCWQNIKKKVPSLGEDQSGQRRYSTIGKIQTWRSGRVRVTERNFRALEGERFKVSAEVVVVVVDGEGRGGWWHHPKKKDTPS